MLRVTLLVDSPSKRAHGNAASRLAIGLAETGHVETTLLCYGSDPAPQWLPAGVRVERLGVDRASRSLRRLTGYLRMEQPDVLITRQVHANFVGLAAAWIARLPPAWRGKLVLVSDANIELSHASNWRDNKWLAKATYRFSDGVIAPSPEVRQNVIKFCRIDPAAAAVIPNAIPRFSGVLAPPPHPWLRADEPPVFLHVSNMLPLKRVELLIDSFAALLETHTARLLILGDGPRRSRAIDQIRQLGIDSQAEAVGWVDEPLQFAARAWALVHPSDQEGFAQVLIEAMSVGCPVIATDALGGGPRFVTEDGKCGMLLPRGDGIRLTDAMARILRPDVRTEFSRLGLQRAEALSPAASATALLDFLSSRFGIAA